MFKSVTLEVVGDQRLVCVKRIAILLVLFCTVAQLQAGPITFLTALPVAERQGVLRVQYLHVRATDDPTPLNRELTINAVPIVLAAGVTSRLAAFAAVPYIDKSIDVDTPIGRVNRSASGIGDLLLLARYSVIERNEQGSTLRIDPFVGAKAPIGSHRRADALGRLPQPLQPGSGSWDGLVGAVLTRQTLDWELDADSAYRWNGDADRFRLGNEALADVSFQYRAWPRKLAEETPSFIYAVLESNLDVKSRDRLSGVSDPASGGTSVDVDFGLQYVREKYIIEAALIKPVVQNLRGQQLKRDYEFTIGFRLNFSFPRGGAEQ